MLKDTVPGGARARLIDRRLLALDHLLCMNPRYVAFAIALTQFVLAFAKLSAHENVQTFRTNAGSLSLARCVMNPLQFARSYRIKNTAPERVVPLASGKLRAILRKLSPLR